MTIYEFMLDCTEHDVRLEVPVRGLQHAVVLFRRLDDHAASGAGRIVEELPGHSHVADLTPADAHFLLEGIDDVWVGRPGKPERGPLTPIDEALAAVPAGAVFEAMYFKI